MCRKLLLFITDAGFHFAGDGQVKWKLFCVIISNHAMYSLFV